MRQSRRLILRVLLVAAVVMAALALNTGRNVAGWLPLSETPEVRLEELSASWRIVRPPGPGPFPVAVLLSGCDGVQDNMDLWARFFVRQGRAALILDSHSPRGLWRRQAWRAVCSGQVLTGAERAADLSVALASLDSIAELRGDDVILLGTSHGGWAVMELMAALGQGSEAAPLPGLTDWSEPPARQAARIGDVVMLYPYCGFASGGGAAGWPRQARGLMILAGRDRIVDPGACRAMAAGLADRGARIAVAEIAGVDHGFDQRRRSVLSPLRFDAAATARAQEMVRQFASGRAAGL